MKEYKDSDRNELKPGFYIDLDEKENNRETDNIFYFTGKYDKDGLPIFDNGKEERSFYMRSVMNLQRIPDEKVKKIIRDMKKRANNLEIRLEEKKSMKEISEVPDFLIH